MFKFHFSFLWVDEKKIIEFLRKVRWKNGWIKGERLQNIGVFIFLFLTSYYDNKNFKRANIKYHIVLYFILLNFLIIGLSIDTDRKKKKIYCL